MSLWESAEIERLRTDCDQLQREVTRLSGKTGFCTQCEVYAKERSQLQWEVEKLQGFLQMDANQLAADRDHWRTLAEEVRKIQNGPLVDDQYVDAIDEVFKKFDATQKEPK